MRLALKLFRGEPAISGFDWNFSPIHSSSPPFSTDVWFGPPWNFTSTSTWPWIGHPVSGLRHATSALFRLAFASASNLQFLTSLHNATRRSVLQKVRNRTSIVLLLLVNTGFQVLFHSPPGVLFTFPSRYYALSVTISYLGLEGGPPCFPPDFSCPAVLWCRLAVLTISCTGLLPSLAAFSKALLLSSRLLNAGPQPRRACSPVWPLSRSLAATQEIIIYFLFLRVLRCFSSPGARHKAMNSLHGSQTLLWLGSPIRISADHNLFAVPRSFSQLTTSFIGVWCLGIHPALFVA